MPKEKGALDSPLAAIGIVWFCGKQQRPDLSMGHSPAKPERHHISGRRGLDLLRLRKPLEGSGSVFFSGKEFVTEGPRLLCVHLGGLVPKQENLVRQCCAEKNGSWLGIIGVTSLPSKSRQVLHSDDAREQP